MRNAECGVRNEDLRERTKQFALSVLNFTRKLPRDMAGTVIGRQMLRSGTSVGANYRSACRAKSSPDFINKLSIVEEELDETLYWLELLVASKTIAPSDVAPMVQEGEELIRIVVASIRTAKRNQSRRDS